MTITFLPRLNVLISVPILASKCSNLILIVHWLPAHICGIVLRSLHVCVFLVNKVDEMPHKICKIYKVKRYDEVTLFWFNFLGNFSLNVFPTLVIIKKVYCNLTSMWWDIQITKSKRIYWSKEPYLAAQVLYRNHSQQRVSYQANLEFLCDTKQEYPRTKSLLAGV